MSVNADTSLLRALGLPGGARVADTTRGNGMGYGIMKSAAHSGGASPHLSWGSQIARVTSA